MSSRARCPRGDGGIVDFDAEVSPDGNTLYVSVGTSTDGIWPREGRHWPCFDREGGGFVADPDSSHLLQAVNTKKVLDLRRLHLERRPRTLLHPGAHRGR